MSDHHHGGGNVEHALDLRSVLDDPTIKDSWERIVVAPSVKQRLLNHALLTIAIRESGANGVRLPVHGLLVISGPPGVGKTSLARGLAYAVGDSLAGEHGTVRLAEVNMHVLSSEFLGRTQRNITQLFQEELPSLAEDGPVVVVLDEIEVLAVSRAQSSFDINPVDVFRGTAALLSALDWIARSRLKVVIVGTTNLGRAVDEAVRSRTDLLIDLPLPGIDAIQEILGDTLAQVVAAADGLAPIASEIELHELAAMLVGQDGRQVRKFVLDTMAGSRETAVDPSRLTVGALLAAARMIQPG